MNKRKLTSCHQNPWYIMMTLHGPQLGEEIDLGLAARNRGLWNAWICQRQPEEKHEGIAKALGVDVEELAWTEKKATEIETLFRHRRRARSQMDVPAVDDEIDLPATLFDDPLYCQKYVMDGVTFDGSHFVEPADFSDVSFLRGANFTGCKFFQQVDFTSARFDTTAYFRGAKFKNEAFFNSARFCDYSSFIGAKFAGQTYFSKAAFGRVVLFSRAQFHQTVSFFECRFGSSGQRDQTVTFANAKFDEPASFQNAVFASAMPVLSGTTFHNSTMFTTDPTHWPPLPGVLNVITGQVVPRAVDYAFYKESAAKLRHVMANQAQPEEEHFFFRREMFAIARGLPLRQSLHIRFYEVISNFGHSIMRPLFWMAVFWFVGAAVYAANTGMAAFTAAGYSFATMFKIFGFHRLFLDAETEQLSGVPWMELFAGGQTVIGFILLFFLGLGLRTRFRLR